MDDALERMLELSREGFFCAQILLMLALESEGKENPDLVRAMSGLNGGIGNTGDVCGALTGGACVLSYFLGKGEADELEHPEWKEIMEEYVGWFRQYAAEYGGISCKCILEGDERNKIQRCPMVMQAVLEKCMELLEVHEAI